MKMTIEQVEEIKECHPESLVECYCDNTHEQNDTVCMYCFFEQNNEREREPDVPGWEGGFAPNH